MFTNCIDLMHIWKKKQILKSHSFEYYSRILLSVLGTWPIFIQYWIAVSCIHMKTENNINNNYYLNKPYRMNQPTIHSTKHWRNGKHQNWTCLRKESLGMMPRQSKQSENDHSEMDATVQWTMVYAADNKAYTEKYI